MHFLGDLQLSGFIQPTSLSSTTEAVYAEHPTLQGNPALQRTGSKNEKVSLEFSLHRSSIIPENFIETLRTYQQDGEILPLTTEAGDLLGDFVIVSINTARQHSDSEGSIISATVSVSLLQWATVDGVADRELKYRQNGFAVGATDGIDSPVFSQAVESQAMESALATGSSAQSIDSSLVEVTANPALEDNTRRTIRARLTTLLSDANSAKTTINGFGGQKYTDTRGMEADLISVINSATTMQSTVDSATLGDLRTSLSALKVLIDTMNRTAQILSRYASTRS